MLKHNSFIKTLDICRSLKEPNLQMQSVFRPCSNFGVSISELRCWRKYNFTSLLISDILAEKKSSFSEICHGWSVQWNMSKRVHFQVVPVQDINNSNNSFWGVPIKFFRQWRNCVEFCPQAMEFSRFSKKNSLVNFSVNQDCKIIFKLTLFSSFFVVKVLR